MDLQILYWEYISQTAREIPRSRVIDTKNPLMFESSFVGAPLCSPRGRNSKVTFLGPAPSTQQMSGDDCNVWMARWRHHKARGKAIAVSMWRMVVIIYPDRETGQRNVCVSIGLLRCACTFQELPRSVRRAYTARTIIWEPLGSRSAPDCLVAIDWMVWANRVQLPNWNSSLEICSIRVVTNSLA